MNNKTEEILKANGYNHLSSFKPKPEDGVVNHWSHMDIWAGPKGCVIVQHWKDGAGCHTYADWPTGSTFDQLDAFLKGGAK